MRILLVEDEAELAHWLSRALARQAGFVVEWADDGVLADRRLAQEEFDAVVSPSAPTSRRGQWCP